MTSDDDDIDVRSPQCYDGLFAGFRTAGGGLDDCVGVDDDDDEENISRFFPNEPKADLISPMAKRPTSPAFFAWGTV